MKHKKREKAVSEIVGLSLVLVIILILSSLYFSVTVSDETPEINHESQFEAEVTEMKETIQESTLRETTLLNKFDSTIQYPVLTDNIILQTNYKFQKTNREKELQIEKPEETEKIQINTNDIKISKPYSIRTEEIKYIYSHTNINKYKNEEYQIQTSEPIIINNNRIILLNVNTNYAKTATRDITNMEMNGEIVDRKEIFAENITYTIETDRPENFNSLITNDNIQNIENNEEEVIIEFTQGQYEILQKEIDIDLTN